MEQLQLKELFECVARGRLSPDSALQQLALSNIEDTLQGLVLDRQRALRTHLGEVVFAPGKKDEVLLAAVQGLAHDGSAVLVSRVSPHQAALLQSTFPQGCYWDEARLFALGRNRAALSFPQAQSGDVLVISAGAADRSIAAETCGVLQFWDISCGFISDVGIAGLHRLRPHIRALHEATVAIVIAGMEGALPGVVAGLAPCPIVAVPTSVGYGVGANGYVALASMLCSCVPGISVTNIDNGFGAAAFAAKLIKQIQKNR